MDEEEKGLREEVKKKDESAWVHFELTEYLYKKKRFEEAKKEFIRTLECDPGWSQTYLLLLDYYKEIKKDVLDYLAKNK
ncbi:TPA_asm: hp [Altiarchaeum virus]|nr:TPA_asm: hp [Altiarchaeum virus]